MPGDATGFALQNRAIRSLFTRISRLYDPLNRVLTLGIDILWRRRAIARLAAVWGQTTKKTDEMSMDGGLKAGKQFLDKTRILDLATGTADLAIGLARQFPQAEVTGVDLTPAMLAIGEQKVARAGLSARVRLQEGDAVALAFPDASFDAVTCAFGFRNFPDRPRALAEAVRVLKPGGILLVLELLRLDRSVFARFTSCWLKAISGIFVRRAQRSDYAYLRASIASAPSADEFTELASLQGLKQIGRDFFRPSCACLLFAKMRNLKFRELR